MWNRNLKCPKACADIVHMCRGESIQNCLWNICAPYTMQVVSIWNAKICPNGLYFYRFSYIYASVWHKCFLNKVSAETAWNEVKLEEYMQCLSAAVFVTLLAQHTHTHTQNKKYFFSSATLSSRKAAEVLMRAASFSESCIVQQQVLEILGKHAEMGWKDQPCSYFLDYLF